MGWLNIPTLAAPYKKFSPNYTRISSDECQFCKQIVNYFEPKVFYPIPDPFRRACNTPSIKIGLLHIQCVHYLFRRLRT